MHDVFRSSGGLSNRRTFRHSSRWNIPGSLAVRLGFMGDVERPLPEEVSSKRQWQRLPASFRVRLGGKWRRVTGDVSAGGALLLYPKRIQRPRLEVVIQLRHGQGTWIATGEIVRSEVRGWRYAHHLRFVSPGPIQGLDAAIKKALRARHRALPTV
ncbi:MAG TPA: PilZ domain-containing protein [Myxococcaceae bacterium]|nr:PilZ domain-containing protein [Myxococcaceae bacterium]